MSLVIFNATLEKPWDSTFFSATFTEAWLWVWGFRLRLSMSCSSIARQSLHTENTMHRHLIGIDTFCLLSDKGHDTIGKHP